MPPRGSSSAQSNRSLNGSKRHHPYKDNRRVNDDKRALGYGRIPKAEEASASRSAPPSCSAPPSRSAPPPAAPGAIPTGTVRDVYLDIIRDKHPWFKPRNDFDISEVINYQGSPDGVWTWLDGQLALLLATVGDFDAIMDRTRKLLDTPRTVADVTGYKPKPGAPNVFVRPIPNSEYSIRLFPGSFPAREYCLDFVRTSTGEPVNSPFKFELWTVPSTTTPWLGGMAMRVYSLERVYGNRQEDIVPGQEKFLLRDGQSCVLKRPGQRNLRFTVPVRAAAVQAANVDEDVDEIDFPQTIG